MVKHHKKKKGGSKKSTEKLQLEEELENLDRFAGSSDEESDGEQHQLANNTAEHDVADMSSGSSEEESDDDYREDEVDDGITEEDMKEAAAEPITHAESCSDDSDNDYQDADAESDDDDLNGSDTKATGMSNAMARILGGSAMLEPKKAVSSSNVVLSKTTTPLQRLQQKIKNEQAALRQKRRERRSENLSAMRLPLAPTAGMSADKLKKQRKNVSESEKALAANAKALTAEIESERTHRRIATRGVVALFNAISKHRAQVAAEAAAKEEEKKRLREEGGVKRKTVSQVETSKHGFLDMIKSAAARDKDVDGEKKVEEKQKGEKKGVGWSALKDDFMMNSKLKDWDKELSDDEDEEVDVAPVKKRVKAS